MTPKKEDKPKICKKCGNVIPDERYKDCPKCSIDEIWKTQEWRKISDVFKKIPVKPITNPLSTIKEPPYLMTGTVLDELFGGGLRRGQLVEIFGSWGSGKTQFCFTAVVESKQKVIFVDSEETFSVERIKEIARARGKSDEEIANLDKRILLYKPRDWREQLAILHQLPEADDVDLIIVDSLMAFFREEEDFVGRQTLPLRQSLARIHLSKLKRDIGKRYNAVVIITNQVTAVPDSNPYTPNYEKEQGVGGYSIHHVPQVILYFRKAKDPKRIARVMKSNEHANEERVFKLGVSGIEDTAKTKEGEKEEQETELEAVEESE